MRCSLYFLIKPKGFEQGVKNSPVDCFLAAATSVSEAIGTGVPRQNPFGRAMKKAIAFCNCFFQLYSPYGEWYCCAVIFGFLPSDIRFASVRANIISL